VIVGIALVVVRSALARTTALPKSPIVLDVVEDENSEGSFVASFPDTILKLFSIQALVHAGIGASTKLRKGK